MSWITGLAGKAEELLNLVDQGAAVALSKSQSGVDLEYDSLQGSAASKTYDQGIAMGGATYQSSELHPSYPSSSYISSAASNIISSKTNAATILAGTANLTPLSQMATAVAVPPPPAAGVGNGSRPSAQFVRPKKVEPDDEQALFDFLNSPAEKAANGATGGGERPKTPLAFGGHSRASSSSSLSASGGGGGNGGGARRSMEDGGSRRDDASNEQDTSESLDLPRDSSTPASSLASGEDVPDAVSVSPARSSKDSQSQELSNLRLENQLLRNEVSSLNQEMVSLMQRNKQIQEDLGLARARMEKWDADASRGDRVARLLQARVDDLTASLAAKDSQLAVLKVRLSEADQLLRARTEALDTLQEDRNRILHDQRDCSSLQTQALHTVEERLHDAEASVRREQESYRKMQSELTARVGKLEAERQSLAESLTTAERRSGEEKRRSDEMQQQLKAARATAESVKQELADYKQKATRILQSKEKLISSLKEGVGMEGVEGAVAASCVELEELRHERDLQREETQRLQGLVQQLRVELQDSEVQQAAEVEAQREQQQELHEQLGLQQRARQEAESELDRQKQEYQYIEEELHRTKTSLHSRIGDREEEIKRLRNQLTAKSLSSSGQAELEGRLHQLTETLIQKQTLLEALGTEKNSLVIQLERLEQQLRKGASVGGATVNMPHVAEGARSRVVPVLFSDTDVMHDGMYGKVRKAANTIDKFSIRLGVFLRRYPIARVLVIVYMALLHVWVMIVLLTYTPEIHHSKHNLP
ncbi:golgin subfamily A member 5 [Petromyzon marinus]|uniref:Golgin subfamily A member 5 n=1 Tax=Petromyzon marinus TaxID=7757 RepID=A0AAJ7WVV7_PETMA|nr:golgin subfamily A member 5 [Petromyzon marinus]